MKPKQKLIDTATRLFILMVGLTIAHLGVTLFLLTSLGSDPYNVFVQGIFRTLKSTLGLSILTHGYTHIIISFLVILFLLATKRSYIKLGTVLCMIFGGPIIDMFTYFFGAVIHKDLPIIIRVMISMIGCIILAYGMTIVIKSEAGTGPNDLIAIVISDRLKKKFSIIRIIVDITFVIIGYLMGGVIGLGTMLSAFLVGPVAGFFLPVNDRLVQKLLNTVKQKG